MAYSEKIADRLRELLAATDQPIEEKKMFSGLCFMVNDKMCVAARPDSIMVRFDPVLTDEIMEKEGVMPMVHSGKIMPGYAFVDEAVLSSRKQLAYWVDLAMAFNPFAKVSKGRAAKKKVTKAKTPAKKAAAKKK